MTELDEAKRSLQESHDLFVRALMEMVPVVKKAAREGDSLAELVLAQYEAARTHLEAENIAAGAWLAAREDDA
jgi:hypothetical protein